jgi:hypothetical protein
LFFFSNLVPSNKINPHQKKLWKRFCVVHYKGTCVFVICWSSFFSKD